MANTRTETESVRTMWDEWFDGQYDLNRCIELVVKDRSAGKPPGFAAALYSGVIEHCAEQLRGHLPALDDE